jgi:Phage tail tube protein
MPNLCGISAAESNRAVLRYVAEDPACWAVTPTTSGTLTRELRITASSLTATKETQISNEIRADRMVSNIIEVGAMSGGDIEFEFSAGSQDDFLQAFLLGTWSRPMTQDVFRGANVSWGTTSRLDISGGDYTDYFVVGRRVKTAGFTNPNNNNYWQISSLAFASGVTQVTMTTTTATVETGNAFSEIADANDVIILNNTTIRLGTGGANVIDSNGGNAFASAIAAGQLVVGQRIYVEGLGYEVGELDYTGQPTDADTVTLFDGEKTVVLEFDSNSAFVRGRTQVAIAGSEDATMGNFVAAVNTLYAQKKIAIGARLDAATNTIYLRNYRAAQGGSIAESTANMTATAFSGGAAANHGFFTVSALADDVITVSSFPGTNANAGALAVTIKGSHVRNPGVLSEIVKQSFTVETGFTDVNQYFVQRGQRVGSFSLSVASGEIVTGTIAMEGKDTTTGTVSTLSNAPYAPLASTATEVMNATVNVGDVRKNGVTLTTALQSIEIEGDANLRTQNAVANKFPAGIGYGRMNVTGKMTAYFETLDMYDHFLNHDTISMSFDFRDNNGLSYTFTMPAVKITSDPIAPGGIDQDIMEELDFVTQRDPVLNTQFMVDRYSSVFAPLALT